MTRRPECITTCKVQCWVDKELVSLEGQLPTARQETKRLAAEREIAEGYYMESMDDASEGERSQLGQQYRSFDALQQMREASADRHVNECDSLADELVGLGAAALAGCSGPTEEGLCTGPVQEGFYLEEMTAPKA